MYSILSLEKGRTLAQVDIDFFSELKIPKFTNKEEEKLENFYFKKNQERKKKKKSESFYLFKLL